CDGPDGNRYYWHDIRKEKLCSSRRNFRGGGIMVWGAIASTGRLKLCFNQNLVFMQDNAPFYVSKRSREWFDRHRITLLPWPGNSPDLNPMENVWGYMVRKMYARNAQFRDVTELKRAIVEAWHQVNENLIHIYSSMNNRVFQLIRRNGSNLDY
ncbi:hypothetical protein OSTOST_08030, partial [Ostertagia ostertagi]